MTSEAGVIRKVEVREGDGTRVTEEDISIERTLHSKSKSEDSQCTLHVSIVKEKNPVGPRAMYFTLMENIICLLSSKRTFYF